MKKLISLFLALMMVVSLAAVVSADEGDLAADGWSVANDNFLGWTKEGDEIVGDFNIGWENAEPMKGLHAVCQNERTNHIRLDKIVADDGRKIPKDTPYAVLVESDQPIVVQASRLDVSQPEYALMTTIAY
jgi:hypothetical protein